MVGFKNRYMVMEVFVDPNKNISKDDPIILSQHNVSKAIKDSILINFGECGLASSLGSFQGNIKACKSAALKCEDLKFEHLKLVSGAPRTEDANKHLQNLERIKMLEH
ncbi:Ribonuclease P/MRP protein subunit [Cynara cardunculus var. scolymus]|uniref:Ribonuclease P/MRP protein subunit n=1 Tax=Cynara cardunculus var. scolymus TaxID=59895 RepID=A0A118JYM3_CYNCS|nr:Ribonuclease P/MRP protein subunit [Cynara cardunculus var. scolymus]